MDSILFIRSAEREHSGTYELVLKIENMEDRGSFQLRVVGKCKSVRVPGGVTPVRAPMT